MTAEYKRALTEVYFVLKYMNDAFVEALPSKFLSFLNENMDKKYVPNISRDVPINEQYLKKDTKVLLSILYRRYWCDSETKKYLNEIKEILPEQKNEENIDYFKDFVDNKNEVERETKEKTQMITYNEESKIKSFFEKIRNIFLKIFKK